MPRHPIYIPLLPPAAQAVIGKPHADSARAVQNLQREGFAFSNMVDIFDAGPVLSCPRDDIRTIRASQRGIITAIVDGDFPAPPYLIGTTVDQFRAAAGPLEIRPGEGLAIAARCARALELGIGDGVRFAELNAPAV